MADSVLIGQLKQFATLTKNSNQGQFFQSKVDAAKDIKVERMEDVLTKEQIRVVKRLDIRKKECYRNAYLVAQALNCQYVEGQMLLCFGIDHAFNKIGDHYFDATKEICLGEDPTETEYISIGEWSWETVFDVISKTGQYGDIYNELYIQSLNKSTK